MSETNNSTDVKMSDSVMKSNVSIKVRDRKAINNRVSRASNGQVIISKVTNEPIYIKSLKPVKPKMRDEIIKKYQGTSCQFMYDSPCSIDRCTLEKCSRAVEKFKSVTPEQPLPSKHKAYLHLGHEAYNNMMKREKSRSFATSNKVNQVGKPSFFSDVERNELNKAIEGNITSDDSTTKQIDYPIDMDDIESDI